MNESKYPKSLSILLALNLCALLTMLLLSMDEIGDGARFVSGMTGMQSIVMALGLGLIALPKAKGKRLGMLGILGMAIAAPVIILYCGHLLAESGGMDRTEQRVFTLLSFYAAADSAADLWAWSSCMRAGARTRIPSEGNVFCISVSCWEWRGWS